MNKKQMQAKYKHQSRIYLEQLEELNFKINTYKKLDKRTGTRINTVGNNESKARKLLAFDPDKTGFKAYGEFKKMVDMGIFKFLSPNFSGFTLPQASRLTRNTNLKTGRRELGSLMFELYDKLSMVRGTPHKSRKNGKEIDNEWGARQIITALQFIKSPYELERKLNSMAKNVSYNYESNLVALYYQVFAES